MEIFSLTLSQMLMMFTLMAIGFVLRKTSVIPDNAHITISKLETFVFVPALTLYTQMTQCTVKTFAENAPLILYGLVMIAVAIALSYPLSALYVRKWRESSELEYERNVYKYALSFANYGFVGNFIILGIWGSEVFYKYSLFTLSFAPISLIYGLYLLIPRGKNEGKITNLKKALLSPPLVAMIIGMVLGLCEVQRFIPPFLSSALENASACMGPVAMLITGFVVGGYGLPMLFLNKTGYAVSFVRLIAIPSIVLLLLKAFGANNELIFIALISFGTPVGLNSIIFPSAYGGDTKPGASMVMTSQLISVITIPLLYYVFTVLI